MDMGIHKEFRGRGHRATYGSRRRKVEREIRPICGFRELFYDPESPCPCHYIETFPHPRHHHRPNRGSATAARLFCHIVSWLKINATYGVKLRYLTRSTRRVIAGSILHGGSSNNQPRYLFSQDERICYTRPKQWRKEGITGQWSRVG